jgi:hypothetical protein
MRPGEDSSVPESLPDLGEFKDKERIKRGCRTALLDIWLIIGSIGMALLGVVSLSLIASAMGKDPERYSDVSRIVRLTIDNRGWFVGLSIFPAVLGLVAIQSRVSIKGAWILRTVGTLCLAAMMFLVFAAFLALITPLYQYQPL